MSTNVFKFDTSVFLFSLLSFTLPNSFSYQLKLMVFPWILSDSKSPYVSRTLLSILVILNNVVFWMITTRPITSKSSSPFNNPLVTIPKATITIDIIVPFMFHNFLDSLEGQVTFSFFTFFQFYSVISRTEFCKFSLSLSFFFFFFC